MIHFYLQSPKHVIFTCIPGKETNPKCLSKKLGNYMLPIYPTDPAAGECHRQEVGKYRRVNLVLFIKGIWTISPYSLSSRPLFH